MINDKIYNLDIYTGISEQVNENCYNAHREYIDIQYLISGSEKLCSLPLEYLKETKVYSKDIDAAFYKEVNILPQEMMIGNGYFAVFYPQDGHMPCLCVDSIQKVKKVVVKVEI